MVFAEAIWIYNRHSLFAILRGTQHADSIAAGQKKAFHDSDGFNSMPKIILSAILKNMNISFFFETVVQALRATVSEGESSIRHRIPLSPLHDALAAYVIHGNSTKYAYGFTMANQPNI